MFQAVVSFTAPARGIAISNWCLIVGPAVARSTAGPLLARTAPSSPEEYTCPCRASPVIPPAAQTRTTRALQVLMPRGDRRRTFGAAPLSGVLEGRIPRQVQGARLGSRTERGLTTHDQRPQVRRIAKPGGQPATRLRWSTRSPHLLACSRFTPPLPSTLVEGYEKDGPARRFPSACETGLLTARPHCPWGEHLAAGEISGSGTKFVISSSWVVTATRRGRRGVAGGRSSPGRTFAF